MSHQYTTKGRGHIYYGRESKRHVNLPGIRLSQRHAMQFCEGWKGHYCNPAGEETV